MILKNVLNKPYKYGFILKKNKYYKILKNFFNIISKINITQFNLKIKNKKIINNLYKSISLTKFLNIRLDTILLKIGICKTIKQARYIITYNKILVNGIITKNYNFKFKNNVYVILLPCLYNKLLKNNIKIFKNYLFYYNKNINNNFIIININKYKFYII